jgi:hypothetical protein
LQQHLIAVDDRDDDDGGGGGDGDDSGREVVLMMMKVMVDIGRSWSECLTSTATLRR